MTWREWRAWLHELPLELRWFPWLMLIRPGIDGLYWLKSTSAFLSPLNLVGFLTPFLVVWALTTRKAKTIHAYHPMMGGMIGLAFFNALVLLVIGGLDFVFIGLVFKAVLFIVLYPLSKRLVRSKRDLMGILTAFYFSLLIPLAIFIYELLVNPIGLEYSRGLERYSGMYADIMNYAIYLTSGLMVTGYRYVQLRSNPVRRRGAGRMMLLAFAASLICLFKINHSASLAVYLLVAFLLFIQLFTRLKGRGVLLVVLLGPVLYAGYSSMSEAEYEGLIGREMQIYQGEQGTEDQLLHGRVGRWKDMFAYWGNMSPFVHVAGMSLDGDPRVILFVTVAPHNDFIRILFLCGGLGLVFYVLYLVSVLRRTLRWHPEFRYLLLSVLAIIVLYSISTVPTFYAPLMYLVVPIFAYLDTRPVLQRKRAGTGRMFTEGGG